MEPTVLNAYHKIISLIQFYKELIFLGDKDLKLGNSYSWYNERIQQIEESTSLLLSSLREKKEALKIYQQVTQNKSNAEILNEILKETLLKCQEERHSIHCGKMYGISMDVPKKSNQEISDSNEPFSSRETRDQMSCVYACIILYDSKQQITCSKIEKIMQVSGITNYDVIWPKLFEDFFGGEKPKLCIEEMIQKQFLSKKTGINATKQNEMNPADLQELISDNEMAEYGIDDFEESLANLF